MRITQVNTYFVRPRWGFVEIITDEGLVGWGEAVLEGHAKAVLACVQEMKDYLIGADPAKIEVDLVKIIPPEYSSLFCHQIVEHGRNLCIARRPRCTECPLAPACDFAKKQTKKERA